MKIIKNIVQSMTILFLVTVAIIYFSRDILIKSLVNKTVTEIIKVPFTINEVDSQLFSGKLNIQKLRIGNPQGWDQQDSMRFEELAIDINTLSLLSDTIIINEVIIDSPYILYDFKLEKLKSNLKAIIDNINKNKKSELKINKKADIDDSHQKKFLMTKISIINGQVETSVNGVGKTIKLQNIYLEGIGNNKRLNLGEIIKIILKNIAANIKLKIPNQENLINKGKEILKEKGNKILKKLISPVSKELLNNVTQPIIDPNQKTIDKNKENLKKIKGLLKRQ